MSEAKSTSKKLKQFLAPKVAKPKYNSTSEAFGLLSFGIVLMRNLRFRAKAVLIFLLMFCSLCIYFELKQSDGALT